MVHRGRPVAPRKLIAILPPDAYGGRMGDSDGLEVRACTAEDVDAVLALARAEEERVVDRPSQLMAADIRGWWGPIDLATCTWLVTAAGTDRPVGTGWLYPEGTELGLSFPSAIGDRPRVLAVLVDRVEARAAELGLQRLHLGALLPDPAMEQLALGRGYRPVRRFYDMAITLDGAPPAVALPDGFTLRPATVEDARDIHAALSEAFEDHWEHHAEPFEEWWSSRSSDPEFDISWWFVVLDGDRTAAAIRTAPNRNGGVYVTTLGVRRAWRGRGLAKALLHHVFARAWEAGFRRVSLGVDASSPTGATALYRSVGMIVELESGVWEKAVVGA